MQLLREDRLLQNTHQKRSYHDARVLWEVLKLYVERDAGGVKANRRMVQRKKLRASEMCQSESLRQGQKKEVQAGKEFPFEKSVCLVNTYAVCTGLLYGILGIMFVGFCNSCLTSYWDNDLVLTTTKYTLPRDKYVAMASPKFWSELSEDLRAIEDKIHTVVPKCDVNLLSITNFTQGGIKASFRIMEVEQCTEALYTMRSVLKDFEKGAE